MALRKDFYGAAQWLLTSSKAAGRKAVRESV